MTISPLKVAASPTFKLADEPSLASIRTAPSVTSTSTGDSLPMTVVASPGANRSRTRSTSRGPVGGANSALA